MVDKAERLANLVTYLLSVESPVPLADIVRRVPGYPDAPASARTQFGRDRDDLRDEGIEITLVTEGNDDRYRIEPATYYLPELGLREEEMLALRLAAASVRLEGEDPDDALLKIGTLGEDRPALVALPSDPRLGQLYDALRRRSVVRFRYDGVDRQVEPWGLLCRDGFWYVPGFDRGRAGQRTFRIDRIDGEVAVDEATGTYEPRAGFDPHRDIPAHAFELSPEAPTEALVEVDALFSHRVARELGPDAVREQRPDGTVVVSVPVRNRGGFRSWLFGMLDHATVVGPPAMVEEIRTWLLAVAGEG